MNNIKLEIVIGTSDARSHSRNNKKSTLTSLAASGPLSGPISKPISKPLSKPLNTPISCPISRPRVRRIVLACLSMNPKLSKHGANINILLCDLKHAKALNRSHRGKAYPPNVLTFEYPQLPRQALQTDIAICLPVVQKEANAQGKTLEVHFIHMLVHACLHAQGFDHQLNAEAEQMEALEKRILKRFRVPDPYLA